jgi:hypothetical protein
MTAQGSARTQYRRAIERRNLMGAEIALREIGSVTLLQALDYLALLAELRPERAERAAVGWHGRLEVEAPMLTLTESQLALAALASLCAGERDAIEVLRRLLRRVRPTLWRECGRRSLSDAEHGQPVRNRDDAAVVRLVGEHVGSPRIGVRVVGDERWYATAEVLAAVFPAAEHAAHLVPRTRCGDSLAEVDGETFPVRHAGGIGDGERVRGNGFHPCECRVEANVLGALHNDLSPRPDELEMHGGRLQRCCYAARRGGEGRCSRRYQRPGPPSEHFAAPGEGLSRALRRSLGSVIRRDLPHGISARNFVTETTDSRNERRSYERHVRRRGKTWCIVYDQGMGEDGRRVQRWKGGFVSKREAEAALAKVIDSIATGTYLEAVKLTYRQFVDETWLPVVRETRRPTTVEQYERTLKRHVLPRIGSTPLQKVTAPQLDRLYRALGETLAPSSVRVVAAIVSASLRYAHRKAARPAQRRHTRRRAERPAPADARMDAPAGRSVPRAHPRRAARRSMAFPSDHGGAAGREPRSDVVCARPRCWQGANRAAARPARGRARVPASEDRGRPPESPA